MDMGGLSQVIEMSFLDLIESRMSCMGVYINQSRLYSLSFIIFFLKSGVLS